MGERKSVAFLVLIAEELVDEVLEGVRSELNGCAAGLDVLDWREYLR
jgi:hypothetical protein